MSVQDDFGRKVQDTLMIGVAHRTNAQLKNLILEADLPLNLQFEANVFNYNLQVAKEIENVTLTPFLDDPASIQLTTEYPGDSAGPTPLDTILAAGNPLLILLSPRENLIRIEVTAEDGVTKLVYNVNIYRNLNRNSDLQSLGLDEYLPDFSSKNLTYTISLNDSVDQIRLTPESVVEEAVIRVNGTVIASGAMTEPLPVKIGRDSILVTVTAQDTVVRSEYRIYTLRSAWERVETLSALNAITSPYVNHITHFQGAPWVAYAETGGSGRLQVAAYDEDTGHWLPKGSFVSDNEVSHGWDIASDGTSVWVAYVDASSKKAFLKKWNGAEWGSSYTVTDSAGLYLSLTVASGNPYLAYADGLAGKRLSVRTLAGDTLKYLGGGEGGGSNGETRFISCIPGAASGIVVAFAEVVSGKYVLRVKAIDPVKNEFTMLGGPVSANGGYGLTLSRFGETPYVAFRDGDAGNATTVKKFGADSQWTDVGSPGITELGISSYYHSLASIDGSLYLSVSGSNSATSQFVSTVKKLEGDEWHPVGPTPAFGSDSATPTYYSSMTGVGDILYVLRREHHPDNSFSLETYRRRELSP